MVSGGLVAVDPKLALVREQMPACRQTSYLNAGTNGPLPDVVVRSLTTAAQRELDAGRIGPEWYDGTKADWQQLRGRIATVFGADVDEIALTRSTTEGINIALFGLDWNRGDEVITTNLEHPGIVVPLSLLAHRFGVKIRVADIGHGGGDIVSAIAARVTARTRVIAISHLMWSSGAIMPLKEIAEFARERGILVVVDAAQAAGQIPIDLHDLSVDAYALSGQKWLCGPGGTGALFVRRASQADIQPTYMRSATTDFMGFLLPSPGALRYEIGEFYSPALVGQAAGLAWLAEEVGFDWIYDRVAALGRQCWAALNALEGVTVTTPRDRMAGLICFQVDGWHPRDMTEALHQRGYTIRYVEYAPGPTVARAACGWWCTEEEIDGFVAAVLTIADGPR